MTRHQNPPDGFPFHRLDNYVGKTIEGAPEVLSTIHNDPTQRLSWGKAGYKIIDLPEPAVNAIAIYEAVTEHINQRLQAEGLSPPPGGGLGQYHATLGLNESLHRRVAQWGVPLTSLRVNQEALEAQVSLAMGAPFEMLLFSDSQGRKNISGLRLIRPGPLHQDYNPFHRDGWLDIYHQTVNLWVPLAFCTPGSSLRVFSGSHLWPESDLLRTPAGATWNNKQYTVPALVGLRRDGHPIEPLPLIGQALLFSSFLLHGGGVNTNPSATRISCEFRFKPCQRKETRCYVGP